MTPYTPPEPDYRRLSDLQSGIDNWYSPATLRAEVERVRRETVEDCAKVCDVTPPYPFRPSIEAAHAIRELLK